VPIKDAIKTLRDACNLALTYNNDGAELTARLVILQAAVKVSSGVAGDNLIRDVIIANGTV
jgi:hypothetical protein